MMEDEETAKPPLSPFDAIRHVDEHDIEYWSARELSKILTYDDYRNFQHEEQKRLKQGPQLPLFPPEAGQ